MPIHPVRRVLERDLLPYLVSAHRLRRQWFFRLYMLFGYTTDLIVALAAIGVTTPLLTFLASNADPRDSGSKSPALATMVGTGPKWLYGVTVVFILAWIFLRVAYGREDGQKRAVLAKSCIQILRVAEADLLNALRNRDPMPALNELLERRIRPTVDRGIQENAWPWTPLAPGIEEEVRAETARLCAPFEADWIAVNPLGLR